MGFGPSVTGILVDTVVHHEISTHVARRNACHARRGNEDLCVVLANATTGLKRLFCAGACEGICFAIRSLCKNDL